MCLTSCGDTGDGTSYLPTRDLNRLTSRLFQSEHLGSGVWGAVHGMEQMMIGSWSEEPCTFVKSITRAEEVRKELWYRRVP